ncbi:MAG: DEAD/DEAH box helicase [Nocardioides sp.]
MSGSTGGSRPEPGFFPVTGPATILPADPPGSGLIELSDGRRSIRLPVRTAVAPLTRSLGRAGVHPSVHLLGGAVLLGLQEVAAGRFHPREGAWEPLWGTAELRERIELLAAARCYPECPLPTAIRWVELVVDAVVDAMPQRRPDQVARQAPPPARPSFETRLAKRLHELEAEPDLPVVVTLSLRVEADDGDLRSGRIRVVPQAHDQRNPLHVCDAADLWSDDPLVRAGHGFGQRARTHAAIALRAAAEAWPVLEPLCDRVVPDELTLESTELLDLLDSGVAALQELGVDVLWPRELGRDLMTSAVLDHAPTSSGTRPDLPLESPPLAREQLFAFQWRIALDGDPLTQAEMDQLAAATSPVIKLRDNWVVVDPKTARRAKKRIIRTVKPAEALGVALSGVAPDMTDLGEQVVVGASLLKVRDRIAGFQELPPLPDPAGLRATLRHYQRQGFTWLSAVTEAGLGACLADDMGLGKTVTVIALHLHRRAEGATGPTLVVCPASLLGNWEAELERFAPGTPHRRFHGASRELVGASGFVLTTYGTMRRDAARLAEVDWDLVVADEAQHIKNARTGTARALRTIESGARIALTGTPVENHLGDLWSILDWTTPGLLGSRLAFRRAWAAPIEARVDPELTRRFADLIAPFVLRRRKSDPGIAPELPAKFETDHPLGLTREQTVLYEGYVRELMERISRADADSRRGLVLQLLTGLKQICNHPAQFLRQTNPKLAGRSQKLALLDELLDTVIAEDGAALVFTQYVAMARLLERHLTTRGIAHEFLHGGTPVAARPGLVRRFQEGSAPVFLLSLQAGGTGLNLTRADHVIHFDRWWNPAVEDQATDRAHRIGQERVVQVHRLITRGTLEERIDLVLATKRELSEAVLGGGEIAFTELDDDQLHDLVRLRPSQPEAED